MTGNIESNSFEGNKKQVIEDPEVLTLYSKNSIKAFSFFFSTIFGAVLLASNLRDIGNNKGRFWVIVFGISYTAFMIFAINKSGASNNLAIPLNMIGGLILAEVFWKKFIGKKYVHKAKRIWKPLIISIIILIPIVLTTIYG